MMLYVKKGVPAKKLVLGVPTYGRSFTLAHPKSHGVGAPIKGPGNPGEYTASPGLLAYYEVCDRVLKEGWKKEVDYETGLIYSYMGDQWISYENAETVTIKAKYVKKNGFGGIMIWDIDRDDFKGSCSNVKYPLLSSIGYELLRENQGMYPRFTNMHLKEKIWKLRQR